MTAKKKRGLEVGHKTRYEPILPEVFFPLSRSCSCSSDVGPAIAQTKSFDIRQQGGAVDVELAVHCASCGRERLQLAEFETSPY